MKRWSSIFVLGSLVALFALWRTIAAPAQAPDHPAQLPGAQLRVKYDFVNGTKWGKPRVGFCCISKEDHGGKHKRKFRQINEWLRVYGEVGDRVTVFQPFPLDPKFFVWPPRPKVEKPVLPTGFALFRCKGIRYGFKENPLLIRVRKKDGTIVWQTVEAGGTFGLVAVPSPGSPTYWGNWEPTGLLEEHAVEAHADGSYNLEQRSGIARGYGRIHVGTNPADSLTREFVKERPVNARKAFAKVCLHIWKSEIRFRAEGTEHGMNPILAGVYIDYPF